MATPVGDVRLTLSSVPEGGPRGIEWGTDAERTKAPRQRDDPLWIWEDIATPVMGSALSPGAYPAQERRLRSWSDKSSSVRRRREGGPVLRV